MQDEILVVKDLPSFIRKKGELTDLRKQLDKVSEEAIQSIIELMNKKDQTDKIKLDCAKALIGFNIEVAKIVNQDQMQRMIAEIKFNGDNSKELTKLKDSQPSLNFNDIQDV